MTLVKRFAQTIPISSQLPVRQDFNFPLRVGNEITFYTADNGERFITKGYRLNDAVFSIVSTNAEKAGQVRLYHSKVKYDQRKTLFEYAELQKGGLTIRKMIELAKMQKAMAADKVVDSPLQKLLNKPTRYQSQAEWIEQGFALRELQGEMNIKKFRDLSGKKTIEMMIIPKPHLNIIGNPSDPWDIIAYQFVLNGIQYRWEKEDVLMWKYSNPSGLSTNFEHMRGFAPLVPAEVLMQAMNEGDVRVATSNANSGASGFAFRKDVKGEPTMQQKTEMRRQFNDIVNNEDEANKTAILAGEWGYYNIGYSVEAQKLLEQYGYGFKRLCRVFKTPSQIFDEGNGTWDNQKQAFRRWIYAKIAPNMYNLRGILSDSLITEFGYDPETNLIDCDIMSLPEMSQDLGELTSALKDAWGITIDDRLDAMGYETIGGKDGATRLIPNGYTPLDQLNADIAPNLDSQIQMLGD
jgi:phage portal protein BeeE